jgi:hypothetical protein
LFERFRFARALYNRQALVDLLTAVLPGGTVASGEAESSGKLVVKN